MTPLIKTVLEFALDGDTVQNLIREELPKLGIQSRDAMTVIRQLARDGSISLYLFDQNSGASYEIDPDGLSEEVLSDNPYVFLGKTEKTLSFFSQASKAS
jgi:hypothetical protein